MPPFYHKSGPSSTREKRGKSRQKLVRNVGKRLELSPGLCYNQNIFALAGTTGFPPLNPGGAPPAGDALHHHFEGGKKRMDNISSVFVVVMGIGTVFFGLICIIALCMAMSAICRKMGGADPTPVATAPAPVAAAGPETIPNRQAMVAAIAAAIAEDLGTDVSGIRILSIKKL